mmetsp:Transcript_26882/g.41766  ORF Transcript_26882/g.41766 Transcript_26882/m.41766 type:complete len:82 (+) Transcript_26882:1-246(+)
MNFQTQLELAVVEKKLAEKEAKADKLIQEFDVLKNGTAHRRVQTNLRVGFPEASMVTADSKNASTHIKTSTQRPLRSYRDC